MDARELDYDLPAEMIAQHPAERRDESRLLVYSRANDEVSHHVFRELPDLVGGLTVVNDTRVVPARIAIEQPRGEVLLLEPVGAAEWIALARPTRRLRAGRRYGPVELVEHLGEGRWRIRLDGEPAGADLIPGRPWVHLPVTMGYDRAPELLIDEKRAFLEDKLARGVRLFFTHDTGCALAGVTRDAKGRFGTVDELAELSGVAA